MERDVPDSRPLGHARPHAAPIERAHLLPALCCEAGLTPAEALRTATLNPALFLAAEDSLGTVAPGKLADLVLLEANPLDDIRNAQRIRAVIVNGRHLDRKTLDALIATAEKAVNQP